MQWVSGYEGGRGRKGGEEVVKGLGGGRRASIHLTCRKLILTPLTFLGVSTDLFFVSEGKPCMYIVTSWFYLGVACSLSGSVVQPGVVGNIPFESMITL